ncbi:MAG TPA: DUF4391 domain-containing protein [Flexivirga sp.]|uniref:DUF4391 domain-containing protein n=1 Tax=Flexivirga sp. TaxID=1962927 RepID=UPI002B7FF82F|nr:DUF4391 domain-containing protein [Flexivirga sp.]HWC23847.1 DUF4391 domain-containing protein [Flexivirga sp.]
MPDFLYDWPAAARFGRVIPKTKFYEHGRVSNALRERFVGDVQRIVWAYKLADDTLNLPSTVAVPEIQVFQLEAKSDDVDDSVLAAIDGAVKTPVLFEVSRHASDGRRQVRLAAAPKQTAKASKQRGYSTTSWQLADTARRTLPAAVDLGSLYVAILESLSGLAARPGEAVSEVADRLATARKLQREIEALQRKLRTEPQFNRKVELRRSLTIKRNLLADLTSPTISPASGAKY